MNFLLDDMKVVRKYVSLGERLRRQYKLPNKLPLYEVQFNGTTHLLFKDFYEIIGEALNCTFVNPFFCFNEGETWVTTQDEDYEVALRIDVEPWQQQRYDEAKARRDAIMKRKKYEREN